MDDHRKEPSGLTGCAQDPGVRCQNRNLGRAPTQTPVLPLDRERGAVTAELAVALPAVVLVLVAVLAIALAGVAQLRVTDAARAGARAAAVGESDARIVEIARRAAGDGVAVAVQRSDPWVTVAVDVPVAGGWFGGRGLSASATSTAWLESAVVRDSTQ